MFTIECDGDSELVCHSWNFICIWMYSFGFDLFEVPSDALTMLILILSDEQYIFTEGTVYIVLLFWLPETLNSLFYLFAVEICAFCILFWMFVMMIHFTQLIMRLPSVGCHDMNFFPLYLSSWHVGIRYYSHCKCFLTFNDDTL